MPPAPAALELADFVHRSAATLRGVVAACGHRMRLFGPLVAGICNLLNQRMSHISALMTQYAEGTLPPPPRPRTPGTPLRPSPRPQTTPRIRPGPAPYPLPYRRGWLLKTIQETAQLGGHLQILLGKPEMAAFLAACPQARRPLRTLWWAIDYAPLPDILRAKPRLAPPPPLAPEPLPEPRASAPPPPQPPPTPPAPVAQEASFIPYILFFGR